ncbi:hypothetical protein B0D71_14915 [Pseudomonas laurylsulfativorans]|uniref:Uncharacterized protein n=1 Tax=Pseudomonas laurylsulfativorans TaxID=1943631 RepID=A0A2S3VNJ8_9PSED|nr:hypothetical protein B0D71_14915 [Pseudomonas laurylsulfativorans]
MFLSRLPPILVGASLLAMVANDNAQNLTPSGALEFFASKLAPTEGRSLNRAQKKRPEPGGRGVRCAALQFLIGPQRPFTQAKQISGTVLLRSNRSAR